MNLESTHLSRAKPLVSFESMGLTILDEIEYYILALKPHNMNNSFAKATEYRTTSFHKARSISMSKKFLC